eukprot:scaffold2768_cov32-Tisochrysis_lutea.AAC.1
MAQLFSPGIPACLTSQVCPSDTEGWGHCPLPSILSPLRSMGDGATRAGEARVAEGGVEGLTSADMRMRTSESGDGAQGQTSEGDEGARAVARGAELRRKPWGEDTRGRK